MKTPATPVKVPNSSERDELDMFALLAPETEADRSVETELRLDPIPRTRSKSEPDDYWL